MLKQLAATAILAIGLAGAMAGAAAAQDYRDHGRYERDGGGHWGGEYARRGGGGGLVGFDYAGFDGRRIAISDYEPNLGYDNNRSRFNDRIESLRFRPGQVWQICSDANFRGRCVTIDRPVGDLRRFGMANTISSLRRVR